MKSNCATRAAIRSASGASARRKGDYVVGAAVVNKDAQLLVAGENGIGKRTSFDDYRLQCRRRQRHHHDEDRLRRPAVSPARSRPRYRRAHAHHQQRQDGPHPGGGDPRDRPQRAGREAHRLARGRSFRRSPRSSATPKTLKRGKSTWPALAASALRLSVNAVF